MIIVQLRGGMGNQMFQYAAGRCLSLRHKVPLKLDLSPFQNDKLRNYSLSAFTIAEEFAGPADLERVKTPFSNLKNVLTGLRSSFGGMVPIGYKKETQFQVDPEFFHLPDNTYLEGYWQSEKYFKEIEWTIRNDFLMKVSLNNNEGIAEKIKNCNAVSVHIRRGDYISNPETRKTHGVCNPEYYKNAADIMAQGLTDPEFFIFSDDIGWAKKNLELPAPFHFVTDQNSSNEHDDLQLMTLCRHHIIANSSFSWWGAWLSQNPDKIIIAPKKWFSRPELDTRDLIPDSWCRI